MSLFIIWSFRKFSIIILPDKSYNITIIITTYNQKEYVEKAIDSAVRQTYSPVEVIIVDDFSNDGTFEVVQTMASIYPDIIKVIRMESNSGVIATRNKGLTEVKGNWVSFLDGDDYLESNKLEKEVELLKAYPDYEIIYSNFRMVDETGKFVKLWREEDDTIPEGNILGKVFSRNFPFRILFRNELIKMEVLERIGWYDTELELYEDFDLKIRQSAVAQYLYCGNVGSDYRLHHKGLSKLRFDIHMRGMDSVFKKNLPLLKQLNRRERKQAASDFRRYQFKLSMDLFWTTVYQRRYLKALEILVNVTIPRLLLFIKRF